MLDSWNQSIFYDIKKRLQDSAMKLVHAERNGEAFDSQLVIGVRESYGKYWNLKNIYDGIHVTNLCIHMNKVVEIKINK